MLIWLLYCDILIKICYNFIVIGLDGKFIVDVNIGEIRIGLVFFDREEKSFYWMIVVVIDIGNK